MREHTEAARAYINAYPSQVATLAGIWKITGGTADDLFDTIEELAAMEPVQ